MNVDLLPSTMTLLPNSSHVVLDYGNSRTNSIRILQTYCANSSKSLTITDEDTLAPLERLWKHRILNLPMIWLSSLSIKVLGRPWGSIDGITRIPPTWLRENICALRTFLETAEFAALRSFSIHLHCYDGNFFQDAGARNC